MRITDKEVIQEAIGMKIIKGKAEVFPVTDGITTNRKDKNEAFPITNGIPHPPEITTKKELTT